MRKVTIGAKCTLHPGAPVYMTTDAADYFDEWGEPKSDVDMAQMVVFNASGLTCSVDWEEHELQFHIDTE